MIRPTKKTPDGNTHILVDKDLWVRNFCTPIAPMCSNQLYSVDDQTMAMANETTNRRSGAASIEANRIPRMSKLVIISDGKMLKQIVDDPSVLPSDVFVIGVNRSLAKWCAKDGKATRKMDMFLVNNPYATCMSVMPKHRYYPTCIFSLYTHPGFVSKYRGNLFHYLPSPDRRFGRKVAGSKCMDDYRNPICAAINLSYFARTERLLLVGCDNTFDTERPGSVALENGQYTYPQHLTSQNLIDGMLYWLQEDNEDFKAAMCGHGPSSKTVDYIDVSKIADFFSN